MSSEEKHLEVPAEEADDDQDEQEQPIYLDVENSPLIQNGELKLNEDGSIDPTSLAVSTGQVQINTMQAVDLTSSAVAQGNVRFQVPEPEQVALVPRRAMRSSEIEAAWNKADTIPGLNADYYRRDRMGNIIYYNSYGRYTPYGWEVDHSKPLNKGGTYHPNNLHPLQAKQNRSKNAEYPFRYQEQEPLGVQDVQPNHSQVDLRCALVRNGALSFKPDGSVDERCSAVRNGDVRLRENEDGQRVIDRRSAAARNRQLLLKPSTQPSSGSSSSSSNNADSTDALIRNFNGLSTSSASPAPPSAEAAVDHRSAVVRGDSLLFTQSGAVDRRSAAVRSGEVLLTQSGDIDKRSAAVRNESLLLRSSSPSSASSSSSSPAPSRGPSTSSSISTPTKADGTPDMRYAVNRDTYSTPPSSSYSSSYSSGPTKSDGTPDMRYSANRSSGGGGGSSSSGRSSGGGGGGGRSSGGGGGGRSGGGRR